MPQAPDWKRFLEAGMQFTEMRRSQAAAIAGELVNTGQLARDQVTGAVDEIVAMSRRRTDDLRALVGAEVQRQLGSVGLATRADLARVEQRLDAKVQKSVKRAVKQAGRTNGDKRGKKRDKKSGGKKPAAPE
jgi:polyhydroxyalkanoate synthesis regulator phasin